MAVKKGVKDLNRRQCPQCSLNFVANGEEGDIRMGEDSQGVSWWVMLNFCPGCDQFIIWIGTMPNGWNEDTNFLEQAHHMLPDNAEVKVVYPRTTRHKPVPPEVPPEFAEDYQEACLILADRPKASAALSRRCLQMILREKTEVPHKDLYGEIRWGIKNANLPSEITEILDVPRRIGNVATHPMMSLSTGVIADVEPWEAEWCLEVIESLYDHYFVTPARNAERLARLKQKTDETRSA